MGCRAPRRGITCWRLRDRKRGMARALIKRGGGRPGHAGFARGRRESRRRGWADGAGKKKEGEMRAPTGGAVVSEREGGVGRARRGAGEVGCGNGPCALHWALAICWAEAWRETGPRGWASGRAGVLAGPRWGAGRGRKRKAAGQICVTGLVWVWLGFCVFFSFSISFSFANSHKLV